MRLPSAGNAVFRAPWTAVFSLCLALPLLSFAQTAATSSTAERTHVEEVLNGIDRGMFVGQVAVSPDGKRLAWVEGSQEGAEINVAPLEDPAKHRIVIAAEAGHSCNEDSLSWAPASNAIVFLSDCARPGQQEDLYLAHLDGSKARRLTELNGYVQAPAFSPDGSEIAFLYVPGSMRPAGALAAQPLPTGVIGKENPEVQRIAVASVNATKPAAPSLVSPANLHVYEFNWSPDSKSVAYIAATPPGENNWWVAKLYTEELVERIEFGGQVGHRDEVGASPRVVVDPAKVSGPLHGLQIAVPRWSPDGKRIAFIGGLMSDQGVTGGDVWIVPAEGGQPHDVTPRRPSTPSWITWDGNDHFYVDEIAGGDCQLVRLALHGDLPATAEAPIFRFPGSVGDGRGERSLSTTPDRSLFVFTGSTFDSPMEIYAVRPGHTAPAGGRFPGLTQLTHFNAGVTPAWGKSVSLTWTNEDFHVQGWLTLPKDYEPGKKYPMIVEVHGGPAAVVLGYWGAGGMLSPAAFSALGYFVLQPNPRGSFGEGEAFTKANRKDFGYGDLRDILAGVTTAERKYSIDRNRVGIMGWSYGGFMTMFATTQTHVFKAAVAGAGISDWLSYYGENSIDQWMIPYFGVSVYDDPAVYARSSAMNFIKQAKTPTLLLVGDRDGECPAPQSFEYWHALHDLGVPTQLVVYPNEGHGFVDPKHRREVIVRTAEWFGRYMPPGS